MRARRGARPPARVRRAGGHRGRERALPGGDGAPLPPGDEGREARGRLRPRLARDARWEGPRRVGEGAPAKACRGRTCSVFSFEVVPGKVEGEKAFVPNVLSSQDQFVNQLGLTEYELYTLVKEDGRGRSISSSSSSPPTSRSGSRRPARAPPGASRHLLPACARAAVVRNPAPAASRPHPIDSARRGLLVAGRRDPRLAGPEEGLHASALHSRWGSRSSRSRLGCHHEVEMVPLIERTIYTTDRFYDVQALTKDRAFVVGYGGKILETTDGGRTWEPRPSGVDIALYAVRFTDDAARLDRRPGRPRSCTPPTAARAGRSRTSNAVFTEKDGSPTSRLPLRGARARQRPRLGGRRPLGAHLDDRRRQDLARRGRCRWSSTSPADRALAAADPIFYDVQFIDAEHGWIVGEFGKIMHTYGRRRDLEGAGADADGGDRHLRPPRPADALRHPHGERAGGHRRRPRGPHRAHQGRRRALDLREVEVDVSAVDPLFTVLQLPDGIGWAAGAAGEVMRTGAGDAAWKRAKLGQDVLTWLRGISFSDNRERLDGRRLRPHLPHHRRRQDAGCPRRAREGDDHEQRNRRASTRQARALLARRAADRLPPPRHARRHDHHGMLRLLDASSSSSRPASAICCRRPTRSSRSTTSTPAPSAAPTTSC